MSQLEKIIQRFKTNPANIKFKDLDRILKNLGFELIETKGSHKKI